MRILYVTDALAVWGGIERVLSDKMNYLVRHTDHEVVLLLLWHDEKPFAYPLDERVRVVRMDIPFQHKLRALFSFRKTIRKLNPDITVYTWVMGAFLAANVDEGSHNIKLVYSPEGFVTGCILGVTAFLIFVLLCVFDYRKSKVLREQQ